MVSLDDVARRAASDARTMVDEVFDVEEGLSRLLGGRTAPRVSGLTVGVGDRPGGRRRRRLLPTSVLVAAAAAAVLVVVAVVASRAGDRREVPADPTPPVVTNAPIPTAPGPDTAPTPSTTVTPPTTPAPDTTVAAPSTPVAGQPPDSSIVAVSLAPFEPINSPTECECDSFAVTADGVPVALDAVDRAITVHHGSGPTTFGLDEGIGAEPILHMVGPDGVAYISALSPGGDAPVRDLFAVSTQGATSGQIVASAPQAISPVGDGALARTPTGIVMVGYPAPGQRRPALDAPALIEWVDSSGETISDDQATVWMEFDGEGTVTLVRDDAAGEQRWVVDGLDAPYGFFPTITALGDGGVIATIGDGEDTTSLQVVRGMPDGLVLQADGVPSPFAVDPLGGRLLTRDEQALGWLRPFGGGPGGWMGTLAVDAAGEVTAPGLNELIEAVRPPWAASAAGVTGMMLLPLDSESEQVAATQTVAGDGRTVIEATISGLPDDSVGAARYTLTFEAIDGLYRFVTGRSAWSCQPGRGHQDFSLELCV
jgi:hypothetical protein